MMEDNNVVLTIDVVTEAMGDDAGEFLKVMELVQEMIQNPENFHGSKAAIEAMRLAALRTKISAKCQYYKTAPEKTLTNRRRKDVLMAMYASLEENINCLKLMARLDHKVAMGYDS